MEIAASPRFVAAADWTHGVDADVLAQFGAGLRRDYRHTIERFLALEAIGSEHAQAELRELKAHVFERGEPAARVLEDGLRILATSDLRARLRSLRCRACGLPAARSFDSTCGDALGQRAKSGKAIYGISFGTCAVSQACAGEVADAILAFASATACR